MNTALIGLCTLFGLGITATRTFQLMDDYPTYLFFAQKIAATGGLIEPFNGSRLISYGASSVGQSIYLKLTGVQSVFAFDALLGSLALVILIIGVCKKYSISPMWKWGICILALAGSSSTYNFNLSPWFWLIYLSVAGFFVLQHLLSISSNSDRIKLTALSAIVLSSLIVMRIDNAICTVLAGVFITLLMGRKSLKCLGLLVVGLIASCSGWALAMFESSRTFQYPLMSGYAANSINNYKKTNVLFFELLKLTLIYRNEIVLLSIVLISLYFFYKQRLQGKNNFRLTSIIFISFVVQLILTVKMLVSFDPWMISRYISPTVISLGLFTSLLTIEQQMDLGKFRTTRELVKKLLSIGRAPLDWATNNVKYIFAALCISLTFMSYQEPLGSAIHEKPLFSENFSTTVSNITLFTHYGVTSLIHHRLSLFPLSTESFSTINKIIPVGSRVISAIETPELLDQSKYVVFSLSRPGGSSPPPGITQLSSYYLFMNYLEGQNIDYLILQSPNISYGIYSDKIEKLLLGTNSSNYVESARIIIDWNSMVTSLLESRKYQTTIIGGYAIVQVKGSASHLVSKEKYDDLLLNFLNY